MYHLCTGAQSASVLSCGSCAGDRKTGKHTQSLHDVLETKVARDAQLVGFQPAESAETVLDHDNDDLLRLGERSRVEDGRSARGEGSAVHPNEDGQVGVAVRGPNAFRSVDTTCSESAHPGQVPSPNARRLTSCRGSLRNRSWRRWPDRIARTAAATRGCRDCGECTSQGSASGSSRFMCGLGRGKRRRALSITHLASKRSRGTGSAKRFGPVGGLAYGMVKRSTPLSERGSLRQRAVHVLGKLH